MGLIQALGTETERCWWDGQVLWVITEDVRDTEDARESFVNGRAGRAAALLSV